MTFNCLIMGAAGRDFHDFLVFLRDQPQFRVCCFTAAQIPYITERRFPAELAPGYDSDIPIFSEERLAELIADYDIDFVFFSYSDIAHEEVMHRASIAQAAGASFAMLGPKHIQLPSRRPVIAITATRTGAGKSPLCQAIAQHLSDQGKRVGILRHPMPYGDLRRQRVQRFASWEDLDVAECTVEEREEYAPYIERGLTIFAGVDYAAIVSIAERDSDVLLWDGGNNDLSFLATDFLITVADAARAGDELSYYPGETNFRAANILVLSKARANAAGVELLREHAHAHNPEATLIECDFEIEVSAPQAIAGKRVLAIEDGPTLTHGGLASGAAMIAAKKFAAAEVVDPRPHAVGTLADCFASYPHLELAVPALGYSKAQRADLEATIRGAAPDVVIDASPAGLERIIDVGVPVVRARYSYSELAGPSIFGLVDAYLSRRGED